jgi:phosphoglycolate phosphatase
MLKGATIVFDLDGTLVDTAPDLTHALNHVLTRRGHAAVSAATVRSGVGFGIRVMIEETLRRLGAPTISTRCSPSSWSTTRRT